MNVDVRIMACRARREKYILPMLERLGLDESIVVYDDRPDGGDAMYNARRTWLSPVPDRATHRLVLQDDLLLCHNFLGIMEQCAQNFPNAVFTFYCPRLKPDMLNLKTPYVELKGACAIWGPAVMMPINHVQRMFEWSDENLGEDFKHDDTMIGHYAEDHGLKIMTTVPSTIQHLGAMDSRLGYNNAKKISKVWFGENLGYVNWETDKISKSVSFGSKSSGIPKDGKAYEYFKRKGLI